MNSISTGGGKDGPLVSGDASLVDDYDFYDANDLIARKIVGSRTDLSRKIKHQGFPKPVKQTHTMQGRARYQKRAVHVWLDARAARQSAA